MSETKRLRWSGPSAPLLLALVVAVAASLVLPVAARAIAPAFAPPTLQSTTVDDQGRLTATWESPDGQPYGGTLYLDPDGTLGPPSSYGTPTNCVNKSTCLGSWKFGVADRSYTTESLNPAVFPAGTYYVQVEILDNDPYPSTRGWRWSNVLSVGVAGLRTCRETETPADTSKRAEKRGLGPCRGEPSCGSKKSGPGYNGLAGEMKRHLARLYLSLSSNPLACYVFTSGHRSTKDQRKLRDRWHKIADQLGPDDQRTFDEVCRQLATAGFGQCPTKDNNGAWRDANGDARGGPAKPGSSRHNYRRAADISVSYYDSATRTFGEDLSRFREDARRAKLCGPHDADTVHVELPYKAKGESKVRCHFPAGPAPE